MKRHHPIVLAVACCAAACAPISEPLPPAPPTPWSDVGAERYRVQPGDILELHAPYNPELQEQATVAPDGHTSFQFATDVEAGGHTVDELTQAVRRDYRRQLVDPQITVTLRSAVGTRVYVAGEVAQPAEVIETGRISAMGAITRAGGFRLNALKSEVILLRRESDGKAHLYAIDLSDVISGTHPEQDVLLAPMDVLYVPRDRIGEVSLVFERVRAAIPFGVSFSYGLNNVTLF